MRMRLLLAALVVVSTATLCQAQEVTWKEPIEFPKAPVFNRVIGQEYGLVYMLYGGISDAGLAGSMLLTFSIPDMELVSSRRILMPPKLSRQGILHDLVINRGQICLIASDFDREKGEHQTLAFPLYKDGKTGKPFRLDLKRNVLSRKKGDYLFAASENGFLQQLYLESKDHNQVIDCQVLDSCFKLHAQTTLNLPYKESNFKLLDQTTDTIGNLYLLARVDLPYNERTPEAATYKHIIISCPTASAQVREYNLRLENKAVTTVRFRHDQKKHLLVAGFYSNDLKNEEETGGVYMIRINTEKHTVESRNTSPLDQEFVASILDERQAAKGKEPQDFVPRELILTEDGSCMLLAEQRYEQQVCITDQRTGLITCNDHFYYNDLLVFRFTPEGKVQWRQHIRKKQFSTNDRGPFGSVQVGYHDNTLHLLYNDNPKNINLDPNKKVRFMMQPRSSVACLLTLDAAGNRTTSVFQNNKKMDLIFMPKAGLEIQGHQFLVVAQQNRKVQLGVLKP